jgi:hypothetical protein
MGSSELTTDEMVMSWPDNGRQPQKATNTDDGVDLGGSGEFDKDTSTAAGSAARPYPVRRRQVRKTMTTSWLATTLATSGRSGRHPQRRRTM